MDWWWALRLIAPTVLLLVFFTYFIARRQRLLGRLQERWGWLGPSARHHSAGRIWSGEVEGRRVQVTWFEHNTEIEIEANPTDALGFGRKGQPAELAEVQDGVSIEWGGKVAYGHDRRALQAIADDPRLDEALTVLLNARDRALRAVRVKPGVGVSWFARHLPERELTREDARHLVEALLLVARASEVAPSPEGRRPTVQRRESPLDLQPTVP